MVFSTTWKKHPGSADYNTGSNWVAGLVPATTAFFGASSQTHLTVSSVTTNIGGWTFKKGAPHYVFTTAANVHLEFLDDGIVIKDGSVSLINEYVVAFRNGSSAGSAKITNNQALDFFHFKYGRPRPHRQQWRRLRV